MHEIAAEMGVEARPKRHRPYKPRRAPIDGRTRWAKRRVELIGEFTAELGREPSVRDRVLIDNCAAVAVRVEQLNGRLTRGEPTSDEDLVRLANTLARLLAQLGLPSAPAKAQPSLGALLRGERAAS